MIRIGIVGCGRILNAHLHGYRRGVSMTNDFYCDEALSGRTPIQIVEETDDVLAFYHTRPFWPVHIVVIPKQHVPSLIDLGDFDQSQVHKVLSVVQSIAERVTNEYGACRILTNLGQYQDSKHLHFHVSFGAPLHRDEEGK